jgi:hypothetical protein
LDIIQSAVLSTVKAVNETTLTAPPAQAESGDEPLSHPILEKYGGDPLKLAEAYEHLQREKGRLANEVGDLRREKAELLAESSASFAPPIQ